MCGDSLERVRKIPEGLRKSLQHVLETESMQLNKHMLLQKHTPLHNIYVHIFDSSDIVIYTVYYLRTRYTRTYIVAHMDTRT